MDDDTRKIKVAKLEAAKRQLDCAIELWFLDKDEVSVYTLAAAAYQIIHDINKKRGTAFESIYENDLIKPESRSKWRTLVRDPVNFFKHADSDPEGSHEFTVAGSMMFIVYAISGLGYLQSQSSVNERILFIWLQIHKPDFVKEAGRKFFAETVPVEHIERLRGLSKQEFFESIKKVVLKPSGWGRG